MGERPCLPQWQQLRASWNRHGKRDFHQQSSDPHTSLVGETRPHFLLVRSDPGQPRSVIYCSVGRKGFSCLVAVVVVVLGAITAGLAVETCKIALSRVVFGSSCIILLMMMSDGRTGGWMGRRKNIRSGISEYRTSHTEEYVLVFTYLPTESRRYSLLAIVRTI